MAFNENSLFLFHICRTLTVSQSKNYFKVQKPSICGESPDLLFQLAYGHCYHTTHARPHQYKTRAAAPIRKSQIDGCRFCGEHMPTAIGQSDLVR